MDTKALKPRLAALLLLAPLAAGAEDAWTTVRSPHFHLVGDARAPDIRRVADHLEKFRAAVAALFPAQPLEGEAPTTVIVFKDDASFRPLFPLYQGKPQPVAGLFVHSEDHNYVVLAATTGDSAYETVFHEYMHLLLSRVGPPLPPWMDEGLAELYANAEIGARDVAIGRVQRGRLQLLRARALMPMSTFLAVDRSSPEYNERDKQGIFYAQAWALVHYLTVQGSGEARPLRVFLEARAAGRSDDAACLQAFGLMPAALQKQLALYVARPALRYFRIKVAPIAAATLETAPLKAHEAEFYRGDALMHLGRADEARPYLDRAIALEPGFAPAYRSIGLGYYLARDFAQAAPWLKQAVERDPQDMLARYLRATAAILAAGEAFGPAAAAAVRDDLARSAPTAPDPAAAWRMLAYVDGVLDKRGPEAEDVLRRALKADPGQTALYERLARLLVERGALDDAQRVAGLLRARATPDQREAANALLVYVAGAIARRDQGTAAAGTDPGAPPPDAVRDAPLDSTPVRIPSRGDGRQGTKLAGRLLRMNCLRGKRLEFVLDAGARRLRLRAAAPEDVMLYKKGALVQMDWTCGALDLPVTVFYVPDGDAADAGLALSFELDPAR